MGQSDHPATRTVSPTSVREIRGDGLPFRNLDVTDFVAIPGTEF
jgi:hypothetical protein